LDVGCLPSVHGFNARIFRGILSPSDGGREGREDPDQRNQNVMNRKYLFICIAVIILAVGASWIGRSVYRARHNLVTLDVYNAPQPSVIKQLERQTRETILVGKGWGSRSARTGASGTRFTDRNAL